MLKIYNANVLGITDDSRKVKKDFLFIARPGIKHDGDDFIFDAIRKGAKVIVGEVSPNSLNLPAGVIYKQVKSAKKALGEIASLWYGEPSKKLKIVGVTGTDGKTTTSSLIYWILKSVGKKVGLVSTVSAQIGGKEYDTGFHVTNPEPIALQEFLSQMVKEGCEYAVLEVTSHGIDQERIAGIHFDVGVLTNITHEHLDYHGSFEKYRETKLKFLKLAKKVVLNATDPSFEYFSSKLKGKEVYPYSKESPYEGILPGEYNDLNAAAAASVCGLLGIEKDGVKKAISSFKLPPGRLEEIKNDLGLEIYVDFAHTPNALRKVLEYLVSKKKGKLIAVFGCAGERDHQKRPMMGEISGVLADISILTAEDPRSEKAEEIGAQISEGVKKVKGEFLVIPERGEAIAYAVQRVAKKGDTIVVCGKGHEKSMAYGEVEYPWSDQEAVKEALNGGVKKIEYGNY